MKGSPSIQVKREQKYPGFHTVGGKYELWHCAFIRTKNLLLLKTELWYERAGQSQRVMQRKWMQILSTNFDRNAIMSLKSHYCVTVFLTNVFSKNYYYMVGEQKKVAVIFSMENKCDTGKCKLALLSVCQITNGEAELIRDIRGQRIFVKYHRKLPKLPGNVYSQQINTRGLTYLKR